MLFKEIIQLTSQFVKYFIKYSLLFKNYDLFRIYKLKDSEILANDKGKYGLYNSPELSIKIEGRFKKICHLIVFFLLYSYTLAKFFIITILHRIVYYDYNHLNDQRDILIDKLLINNNTISFEKAKHYYIDIFGHPISKDSPIVWGSGAIFQTFECFCVYLITAFYFHYYLPLDIPLIRCLFDERREERRFYLMLKLEFDKFLNSINFFKYNILNYAHKIDNNGSLLTRENVTIIFEQLNYYQNLIRDYKNNILEHFQPQRFRLESNKYLLTCSLFWIFLAFMIFIGQISFHRNCLTLYDCLGENLSNCKHRYSLIDSKARLSFFWEFVIISFTVNLSFAIHIVIYSFQIIYQNNLIDNLRTELKNCLTKFRLANYYNDDTIGLKKEADNDLFELIFTVDIIQKEFIR